MNTYSHTFPLGGATRPARASTGSTDRSTESWPAPNPMQRVDAPEATARSVVPWPAPDPVFRFDLPAPRRVGPAESSTPATLPPPVAHVAAWPEPRHDPAPPAVADGGRRRRIPVRVAAYATAGVGTLVAAAAVLVTAF